jgi:hypothetical protein
MHTASLILVLTTVALPAQARPDPSIMTPSAAAQYDEARWAEWDAKARMAEGDYDGAVEAEQRAGAARKQTEQPVIRKPIRPTQNETSPPLRSHGD